MRKRLGFGVLSVALLVSCSSLRANNYADIRAGTLQGKLIVQWIEPDLFLFLPDNTNPLTFTRANGEKIQPGRMLTDGGSIPRPMWALRNYSPWGYAPAFIVHDWLFFTKRCKIKGYEGHTLESSADVLAEIIKTMMESGKAERDPGTVSVMRAGVTSVFAKKYWDSDLCIPPPPAFNRVPAMEYTIEFK